MPTVCLCEEFAGQVIAFPKDYFYKIAQRDLEIYNSFNGRNWGELGRKYDLTENALRKIVKRITPNFTVSFPFTP
nr:Mor transcription activator family protein [Aggregatibacter actinomycetemcomitans]